MLFLSATLNHKIKIFYDCEDHEIINRKHLAECDLYFKRSFDNERHPNISAKIFPLGLNYAVTSEDDFAATRLFWNGLNKSVFFDIYNAVRSKRFQRNTTKVHNFEGYANFETNPKILFSARLWKPEKVANETLKQERLYINEVRVECIRKLKARFKEDFVGGLFPDDLTLKNFPDCADTKTTTSKAIY